MPGSMVGCHGKLPSHGDFVRMVGAQSPVEVLDAWLATAPLDARQDAARVAAFDTASPAFSVVCTRGYWWASASFPSRDSVGRRYPFTVFTGVPVADIDAAGFLLGTAFIPFFMRAWKAAQQGWPSDLNVLRAGLPNIGGTLDLASEERRFIAALDTITTGELWKGLFGSADDSRREKVLSDLIAVAGGAAPAGGYRIQPMAHQNHLGFWLMMLTVCGEKPVLPSVVTLRFADGTAPPAATLFLAHPEPAACLAGMWPSVAAKTASRPHDAIQDAGALGSETVPDEFLEPDLALRDLIHGLTSTVRQRRTMRFTRRPPTP